MYGRMTGFSAVVCGLLFVSGPAARAEMKPHNLFTEGMVLQQGIKVPIWGTASDGEHVKVSFQDQEASATASHGKWMIHLNNLKAGGPFELTIAGENTIHFKNVLVGEVWVCSGQSNMQWPVWASGDAEKTIKEAKQPQIRLFTVPMTTAPQPVHDVPSQWQECTPDTVKGFSAVGYHFGKSLHEDLKVPVGLINSSWGGTVAEAWTSAAALRAQPELQHLIEGAGPRLDQYAKANAEYSQRLAVYQKGIEMAKKAGVKNLPKPPPSPQQEFNKNPNVSTLLYNGMIAPLIPFAIRGAIWYQGESNADRAVEYQTLFATMIRNWRHDWGEGDFPFLFVQLAPWQKIVNEPTESGWAELRESQRQTTLKVPKAGMAVITDVGDEKDIHPKDKTTVGRRLALAAFAIAYGQKVDYTGPVYDKLEVQGDKAIVHFKHTGGGLAAKDGAVKGFTIAGEDHQFHNAQAEIKGDTVTVRCKEVAKPVAVRYGWANYPVVNLQTKEGLPASPFRTDDFPMITRPKPKPAQPIKKSA
jgi:sialate O-acetylesterase